MIEINNLTKEKIDKKLLKMTAETVLKGEGKKAFGLSVALISEEEIKKINKKYRGKNKSTDVLSFEAAEADFSPGEILISPKKVKENAEKFGVSSKEELTRVLIHGILHLLGYEHEKSEEQAILMEKKEEHYFSKL